MPVEQLVRVLCDTKQVFDAAVVWCCFRSLLCLNSDCELRLIHSFTGGHLGLTASEGVPRDNLTFSAAKGLTEGQLNLCMATV